MMDELERLIQIQKLNDYFQKKNIEPVVYNKDKVKTTRNKKEDFNCTKDFTKLYYKQYYQVNKDEMQLKSKEYYQEHKTKMKLYAKQYYEKHKVLKGYHNCI
jgi:hypothetical protein